MLPILRHRLTRRTLFTLLFELLALNGVILLLVYTRSSVWEMPVFNGRMVVFAVCSTAIIQFGFWSFGLYSRQVIYSGREVMRSLVEASALLSVVLFCFCYVFSRASGDALFHPAGAFFPVFLGVIFPLVVCVERYLVLKVFNEGCHYGKVVIVGTDDGTTHVIRDARSHHGQSFKLVGVLGSSADEVGQAIEGCRVIGTISQLPEVVEDLKVRTVILALPYDHRDLPLDYLLECKLAGIQVIDAGAFYESVGQKILLERLEPYSVLFPEGYTMTRVRWLVKAGFERLLATALLAVSALPMLAVYVAIRVSSPGGAIYRQRRVGKGGKTFLLYKFRTMVADAEKETGARWAQRRDPRVTWLGKWLRRARVDELPQLFNVLRGEMAFVGPRPERPEFVDELKERVPFYHYRHFVKPGLTGWAQVQFPYARSLDDSREKLRYDLYYIKHVSLFFDCLIILGTLRAVLKGQGVK